MTDKWRSMSSSLIRLFGADKKAALKKSDSRQRDMNRDEVFVDFYVSCKPYTMTGMERLFGVYNAVEYIVRSNIPGDIVECGVWRGGSIMMAAKSLLHFGGGQGRKLYLFDTFEGMPAPTEEDYKFTGEVAQEKWQETKRGAGSEWNFATTDEVRTAMESTGYDRERIVLVKGKVENTLPANAPERIALLRLDTDFYSSTKHELTHLFPRLAPGGVLIIDDFGTWAGSRKAALEYFEENKIPMFLSRLDVGGRIGIKGDDGGVNGIAVVREQSLSAFDNNAAKN